MDKLQKILREYLNKGSERIDVTMVLALIDQFEKDTKEQLLLHNVSQQRELLVAYEKQHYTPNEWALVSKQCEKEIDNFLAINCG